MGNISRYLKHYRSPDDQKVYCCYCGKWLVFPLRATREHVVPLSKGGTGRIQNIKPCCHKCNNERGNRPLHYWLAELKYKNKSKDYDINIKIENIEHVIDYIHEHGPQLFRSESYYKKWINSL